MKSQTLNTFNFINRYWRTALLLAAGSFLVFSAAPVSAQTEIKDSICTGANLSLNQQQECDPGDAEKELDATINTAINIFSSVVGIAAVIMVMYAGFRYVVSGGGEGIKGAKSTLIYAVVGVVIVVLSQTLVKYILTQLGVGGNGG